MNRAWMRRAAAGLACCLVLACVADAGATEIGLRYGRADLRGNSLFPGSGDLGETPLIGLQVLLDILPFIDVELAGEAYDEDFRFKDGEFGDVITDGTGNFKDTAILATGKIGIPFTLLGPASVYGGLGLSAHFLDVKVDPADGVEGDIEDAIQKVTGERSEVEWHAVLGVKTGIPVLPLAAFLEVRYQDVLDSRTPDLGSAYLGVNFIFGE